MLFFSNFKTCPLAAHLGVLAPSQLHAGSRGASGPVPFSDATRAERSALVFRFFFLLFLCFPFLNCLQCGRRRWVLVCSGTSFAFAGSIPGSQVAQYAAKTIGFEKIGHSSLHAQEGANQHICRHQFHRTFSLGGVAGAATDCQEAQLSFSSSSRREGAAS